MNISTHDKKILFVCFRRLLFLTLAFLLGSLAGKAELSLGILRYPARSSHPLKTGALVFQRKEHSPLPTLRLKS